MKIFNLMIIAFYICCTKQSEDAPTNKMPTNNLRTNDMAEKRKDVWLDGYAVDIWILTRKKLTAKHVRIMPSALKFKLQKDTVVSALSKMKDSMSCPRGITPLDHRFVLFEEDTLFLGISSGRGYIYYENKICILSKENLSILLSIMPERIRGLFKKK